MTLNRKFSRHLLYPLYEWFSGRHFLDKLEFLEASQWWDRERVVEYQWTRLTALLGYAFANNSFYRRRFQEAGVHPDQIKTFADLSKIPILTKAEIVEHFSSLVSEGYSAKTLVLDKTSGSTGRNLIFYNDRNTLDWMTAAVLRNMAWYNVSFGDKRFKLWGSLANESPQQKVYMSLRNLCLREYFVSSYELDSKRLALIVKQIKQHQPKALVGYVSALEILANYMVNEAVEDIRIPAIIPAAETLFEHQRNLFESVFHAKVFNRYGSHEFTAIAHECDQHDGMHINAENVYLEIINDGWPAEAGTTGEVVITDLKNFGFPFIRYRMEDLGRLKSGSCSCGRGLPVLAGVEGRVYDLISCPNGTIQTGTFFCKMTRSVKGIQQFQIIQEAKNRIRFKLVTDGTFSPDSVNFLKIKVKFHCGEEMDAVFDFVEAIEPLKSGKRRYVVALPAGANNALNGFGGSA